MEPLPPHEPNPIPEELHSEYEERPFRICTRCGETLSDFDEGYQIAKVFKQGEAIFEYALCGPCHSSMVDEFSSETREAMEQFYAEHLTSGLGLSSCAICGIDRSLAPGNEFTLAAVCHHNEMVESLMICFECMEKSNALVSEQTRDVWRRFIDDNFPGVPADAVPDPSGIPVLGP